MVFCKRIHCNHEFNDRKIILMIADYNQPYGMKIKDKDLEDINTVQLEWWKNE